MFVELMLRVGSSFWADPHPTQVPRLTSIKYCHVGHPYHTWDLGFGTPCECPNSHALDGWDCTDWPWMTWDPCEPNVTNPRIFSLPPNDSLSHVISNTKVRIGKRRKTASFSSKQSPKLTTPCEMRHADKVGIPKTVNDHYTIWYLVFDTLHTNAYTKSHWPYASKYH